MNKFPHQKYPVPTLRRDYNGVKLSRAGFWCGNKKGFTLIELLVSFAVLIMVVSSFTYSYQHGKSRLNASLKLSQATLLIQSEMEKLHRLPFSLLTAGTFADGRGQVRVVPISVDLLSLQLSLNYNPPFAPINLYTLRSSH